MTPAQRRKTETYPLMAITPAQMLGLTLHHPSSGVCVVAVNGELAAADVAIPSGAELALLPPVSGG